RRDYGRIASPFEVLAKQLELFLGRHVFQINDCDLRRTIGFAAEEFLMAINQHLQHERTAFKSAYLITFGKTLHYRQLCKDLESRVTVSNACRAFPIQFDEAV